jgi:hypothetical protein
MHGPRILIAAGLAVGLAAAASAEEVSFLFSPKPGATWSVSETRTKSTTQNGQTSTQTGSVLATLKVISETADGYEMEWTTNSVGAGNLVADGVQPELLIGVPIRFNADTEGVPQIIVDSDKLLDTVFDAIEKGASSAASKTGAANVRAMFQNTPPATLAQVLLADAALIGSCHNYSMEPGKPISQSGPVTAIGGAAVETTLTALMESAGSATSPARIRVTQEIAPGAMTAAMEKLIASSPRKPSPEDMAGIASIQRKTQTDCAVDTKSGEAVSVMVNVIVSASGISREDKRAITVQRAN